MSRSEASASHRRAFWARAVRSSATARLARVRPAHMSRCPRARLDYLTWHAEHSANVALTCGHFAIARSTF